MHQEPRPSLQRRASSLHSRPSLQSGSSFGAARSGSKVSPGVGTFCVLATFGLALFGSGWHLPLGDLYKHTNHSLRTLETVFGPESADVNGAHDGFNTPSVQCRLGLEAWQNENIDRWMKNPPYPLVEWAWEMNNDKDNSTYYRVLLKVLHCGSNTTDRVEQIASLLQWHWKDQAGDTHTVHPEQIDVQSIGVDPKIYFRLSSSEPTSSKLVPTKLWPTWEGDDSIPIEYDLEPYLRCNKVEKENPPPKDPKIGVCVTRFWGQHDLVPEWIAYHRMLGVQHFWFFVSEPFENIHHTLPQHEEDITYIPYNYTWEGHKHNGNQEMISHPSDNGWSAGGENWFQILANNQCLMMAKQYGLDWIMTPDVDEYIAVHDLTVTHFSNPSPLQQYLERYQEQPQVCLHGGGYGRNPRFEHNESQFQLTLDFTYRRDKKFGNGEHIEDGRGAGGRRKCFYNPRMVSGVEYHSMSGGEFGQGNANISEIELFHFRSPMLGPQFPPHRLVSYPEVRDMYRDKVMGELKRLNWTLPDLHKHKCTGYDCSGPDGRPSMSIHGSALNPLESRRSSQTAAI